jgi:hypothetical protein
MPGRSDNVRLSGHTGNHLPASQTALLTPSVSFNHPFAILRNRRVSNGDQVNRIAPLALKRGKSVDFTGYWQRQVQEAQSGRWATRVTVMSVYVVLLCTMLGSRERCVPTAFGSDLTEEACESHRQYMEGHAKPGVKAICSKKIFVGREGD